MNASQMSEYLAILGQSDPAMAERIRDKARKGFDDGLHSDFYGTASQQIFAACASAMVSAELAVIVENFGSSPNTRHMVFI